MPIINLPPNDNFNPLDDEEVGIKAADELLKEDSFQNQAKQALQLAEVNTLMSKSRTQLAQATQQRVAQPLDENGNPTFSTLVDDVGSAGEQIITQNSANIKDATVKRQFELQMRNETKGAQVQARGVSRTQQLQFMEASFTAEHESLVNAAALSPFKQVSSFLQEYQQKLDAGVTLGLLTPEDRNSRLESFRSDVSRAQFNSIIELDPHAAESILINNPERTGMNPGELEDASKLVDAKIRDVESQQKIDAREQQNADESQRKIVAQDLINSIENGEAGQSDILKVKDIINPQEVVRAERKLIETKQKTLKRDKDHQQILGRVTNGDSLSGFTPTQIQGSFNKVVDQFRQQAGIPEGQPVPLSLKASIARVFKGRIKSLEFEMEHALEEGSISDSVEALNAYRILNQENPEFTSSLHQTKDKAGAIADYALQLVDKTDVPEQAAMQRARGAILNADDVERSARGQKFNKVPEFRPSTVGETAREALGGDPVFGFDRRLAPGVTDEFNDLARESYILSGDKDAAISSAAAQMKKNYGETEFNGGRLIMFAPPEKMFPGVDSEELQGLLANDIQTTYPGVDSAQVEIVSDDITRIKPGFISYGMQMRDANGNAVPLIDPDTGQLMRWELNQREVIRQSHINKAVQAREKAIQDRDLFGDIPEETILTQGQVAARKEVRDFGGVKGATVPVPTVKGFKEDDGFTDAELLADKELSDTLKNTDPEGYAALVERNK
jgi:hypothetical protein